MRGRYIGKWIALIYFNLQHTLGNQSEQFIGIPPALIRIFDEISEPAAGDRSGLRTQNAQIHRRDRARRDTIAHHSPALGNAAQSFLERVFANRVVDNRIFYFNNLTAVRAYKIQLLSIC